MYRPHAADFQGGCGRRLSHQRLSTSDRGTQYNAVAERVIRTMKEECIWLRDWRSLAELEAALRTWQDKYNNERPHQSLQWQTPSEARQLHLGHERLAA